MTEHTVPTPAASDQPRASWWQTARANPLFSLALLGALVVMLVDQASKAWIVNILRLRERRHIDLLPFFDLTYVENTGASFGMLSGGLASRIVLSVVALGVVVFLVVWLARVTRPLVATGIAFIIGGAIGNVIDRALYGYVIDFLNFSGLWFPWVFNLADTAINIGVGCLLFDAFFGDQENEGAAGQDKPSLGGGDAS